MGWQTESERGSEPRISRTTKNSNTRSASSLPSSYFTTYQDLSDLGKYRYIKVYLHVPSITVKLFIILSIITASHSSASQYNYIAEEYIPWLKMVPPIDPRTQSPSQLSQETKPSNVNKMVQ